MRTNHTLATAAALALAVSTLACAGTGVGNPEDESDVTVRVEVAQTGQALSAPGGITLNEVRVRFASVVIRDGNCSNSDTVLAGKALDATILTNGAPTTGALELTTTAGDYCSVDMQVAPAEGETASVVIRGTRADGQAFSIESNLDRKLKFKPKNNAKFALSASDPELLILGLDVTTWVDAEELDRLDPGELTITTENNPSLVKQVDRRIAASTRFARDDNRNGKADDELFEIDGAAVTD